MDESFNSWEDDEVVEVVSDGEEKEKDQYSPDDDEETAQYFSQSLKRLKKYSTYLHTFKNIKRAMKHESSAFDQEDQQWIEEAQQLTLKKRTHVLQRMEEKRRTYINSITQMKRTLQTRERVLKNLSLDIKQTFPDLFNRFVQKQTRFRQSLKQMEQQIKDL